MEVASTQTACFRGGVEAEAQAAVADQSTGSILTFKIIYNANNLSFRILLRQFPATNSIRKCSLSSSPGPGTVLGTGVTTNRALLLEAHFLVTYTQGQKCRSHSFHSSAIWILITGDFMYVYVFSNQNKLGLNSS